MEVRTIESLWGDFQDSHIKKLLIELITWQKTQEFEDIVVIKPEQLSAKQAKIEALNQIIGLLNSPVDKIVSKIKHI
jgi:hypothetical protein